MGNDKRIKFIVENGFFDMEAQTIEYDYVSRYWCADYENKKERKMNWIQKVRDYDWLLKARIAEQDLCNYWMHKYLNAILELHCSNSTNKNIGKRLKFKSGNIDFQIVVGNPVTLLEAEIPPLDKDKDEFHCTSMISYSVCKHGDTFNWKTGVMQSLYNFFRDNVGDKDIQKMIQRDLYAKYPELRER